MNAPQLEIGLQLYLDAFFDLSCDRPIGFGSVGLIQWSLIQKYAEVNEFDEDQTDCLHFYVKRMDLEYLNYFESKKPKKEKDT